jgi:hypothetical protein
VPGRDLLARARHRHGRRRPRHPGRVAEVGRARAAAHRARRARRRRRQQGADLPQVPRRPARVRRRRAPMREGKIEPTVVPRNALDVLAQQIVAIAAPSRAPRRVSVDELFALVTRTHSYASCAASCSRTCSTCSTAATRRGVRRAAPADRLGPAGRHDPRAQGIAPARRRQRRHDPRPRPVRRHAARRPPRGRARRGDGLRGAPGADLPAGRDDLADRGDRPRPRDRHPGARRARGRAVLEGRLGRAPEGAGRGDRRVLALGGRAGAPEVLERDYDLDRARRATCSTTSASSRPRPA